MRRSALVFRLAAASAVATGTFAAFGCDKPATDKPATDNTAQVCTDYWAVVSRYTNGDAPEVAALREAQGRAEPGAVRAATVALFRAKARELHAVAARASEPEVRSAVGGVADFYDRYGQESDASRTTPEMLRLTRAVESHCPHPRRS